MTSKQTCIHHLFEAQVERAPEATAVVFDGARVTYADLNRRANQVADYLYACGINVGANVGLYTDYSLDFVVGVLGILKAGGTLVLLDPAHPQHWQETMLRDAHVQMLLTGETGSGSLYIPTSYVGKVISLHDAAQTMTQQSLEHRALTVTNNLLSFSYASGNYIVLEHSHAQSRLKWLQKRFELTPTSTLLSISAPTEENCMLDMFWTLSTGACLLMAQPEMLQDSASMRQILTEYNASILHTNGALLQEFTDAAFATVLRQILVSGEQPSAEFVRALMKMYKGTFSYVYGGLETPYYLEMSAEDLIDNDGHDLAIVGQRTSVVVYVLDARKKLVPPGGSGEIYVAGSGVAYGYLDNPLETDLRFLADSYTGGRMFRTGLRGRYRSNGKIEVQATTSRQAWIGGHVVALDDVEYALRRSAALRSCHVIARPDQHGQQELVGYIVAIGQSTSELWREHLCAYLPASWIPRTYIPVSHIPFTSAGEVDEQALLNMAPVTTEALKQWEQHLRKQEGVEQVAVVVQEHATVELPLHLNDLLPDWGAHTQLQMPPPEESVRGSVPPEHSLLAQEIPPSLAIGKPLYLDEDITTLPQMLLRAARQGSSARLIYLLPDGSEQISTYQQLLVEAQHVLAGLRQLGLRPQDKVIIQVEWCQEFLPVLWGCLLGGIVVVPVEIAPTYTQPTSASRHLLHAWKMMGQPVVVAGSNVAAPLQALAESEGWEHFAVVPYDRVKASGRLDEPDYEWQADDLALIALTSGSTGAPKGVVQRHRNLLSQIQGMIQLLGCVPQQGVTFNWMPLDHVGGVVMLHFHALYLAETQVHTLPQTVLQDPLRWLDYLDRYRATTTWAPNFAFGLINERAEELQQRHWDLSSLRLLFNGGEAIVAKVAHTFLQLLRPHGLPTTAMRPVWGMSETCSGVTFSTFPYEGHDVTDHRVEVGEPMPGFSVRLVDENHQVVEEGRIGHLQVHGLAVTEGYYQNEEANQASFSPDGWFRTGDLGLMKSGQLTITGRAKEIIIINGLNYSNQEIEAAVEELEEIETSYTAACAVRDGESATDQLAVFVVSRLEESQVLDVLRKVRAKVSAQVGITPTYVLPVTRDDIPKTGIGKIQRSQLKQAFEAGQYQKLLKELDRRMGNVNTLPDWFYRKCWQRCVLTQRSSVVTQEVVLVLGDGSGLGQALCEHIRQRQQRCIYVEQGAFFERLVDDHYRIEPSREADYHQLLSALVAEQITVKQVVHLWGYQPRKAERFQGEHLEEAHERGVLSVLYLIQTLQAQWKQKEEKSVFQKLLVVSNQLAGVEADEVVAYEKAPILGVLKTLEQELPWLQCVHVDLPALDLAQDALHVVQELDHNQEEQEVAYRAGQRLVARLERVDWSAEPTQASPLVQEGFYLLSGGLGGVGYELARHLLQEYQAHLLLLGRTPITQERENTTADGNAETPAVRLALLQEQARHGGAVRYVAVDVCDLAGVQQAVQQAQQEWDRPLGGIFHLAGVFQEQELLSESAQHLQQVLRPKVEGTWTLHQLLKDRPGTLFVSFSSVNAFFGGRGVGAYASASSFLESFAAYQRVHCNLRSYCLSWSMWDEIGMSRGYQLKGFSQARGYHVIAPQQGWYSLLTVLHHAPTTLLVGLDGNNQHIRPLRAGSGFALQDAVAYVAPGLRRGLQHGWPAEWGALPDNYRLVTLETLPLRETGEIDVERLEGRGHVSEQAIRQEPRTEMEQRILEIWRDVLKNPQIGVLDNFFELGGHSLMATQVVARMQHVFQIDVPVRGLFENPTVAGLALLFEHARQQAQVAPPLLPVSREKLLPLSFAQQRLWFLEQLQPGNTAYNIPATVAFEGQLDLWAFSKSLEQLLERHEGLRTTFQEMDGQPYQVIGSEGEARMTLIDLQALSPQQREVASMQLSEQEALSPFNLRQGPLLRVCLLRLAEQKHWVCLNMHHITSDGWSMGVLVRELAHFYQAYSAGVTPRLPSLPIQYADYAYWQRQWLQGEVLKEQIRYWTNQLSEAHALELPTDYTRPSVQSYRGARYDFHWDEELTQSLGQLSRQEGVTLFMILLAAFQVLLYRLTGEEDIVVGTDSANRGRLETEGLIGFFINLLALRTTMHENPRFLSVLKDVREMVLGAYAHQELPFEAIIEHLRLERRGNRTPLVNLLFVMQNVPQAEVKLSDFVIRPVEQQVVQAKFDLALFVSEDAAGLKGSISYSADLFKRETIAKMMSSYKALLQDITAHPEASIDTLEILSAAEKADEERSKQQGILARKSKLKKVERVGVELDSNERQGSHSR